MHNQKIKRIGFILVDGFSLMSLSSAVEPLRAANHLSGDTLFEITYIPASGTRATSSAGIISEGRPIEDNNYDFDLVFVVAAGSPITYENFKSFEFS